MEDQRQESGGPGGLGVEELGTFSLKPSTEDAVSQSVARLVMFVARSHAKREREKRNLKPSARSPGP